MGFCEPAAHHAGDQVLRLKVVCGGGSARLHLVSITKYRHGVLLMHDVYCMGLSTYEAYCQPVRPSGQYICLELNSAGDQALEQLTKK